MKSVFLKENIISQRSQNDFYKFSSTEIGDFILSENAHLEMASNYNSYNANFYIKCAAVTANNHKENKVTVWLENREETIPAIYQKFSLQYFEDFKNYELKHSKKADTLIDMLALKAFSQPFEKNKFQIIDMRASEIANDSELNRWLIYLLENNLICEDRNEFRNTFNTTGLTPNPFDYYFRMTPKSWGMIEEKRKRINSNKAFIAMAFKIENRIEVQKAIESACLKSEIIAKTVDDEHFTGKITDKIISMINESLIVIADFTSNNKGVYFEAGYAEGLGRTVIYTINKSDLDDLHFDTKQTNYIVWETTKELEEKLTDRVKVLIKKPHN